MMKVLLVVLAVVAAACSNDDLPEPQALVQDGPRLAKLISCLQGKETCEPYAAKLRAELPAAIKTSCAECPKDVKTFIRKVSLDLQKNHAEDFKVIEDYFDKERVYEKAFNEFLHADD